MKTVETLKNKEREVKIIDEGGRFSIIALVSWTAVSAFLAKSYKTLAGARRQAKSWLYRY